MKNRLYTPTVRKAESNVLVIHIDHTKVARGHQPHVTGAGVHGDKRTKRNRTRSAQNRNAVRECD